MQEFIQQIPTQAATPVEKLVEATDEETPITKQRARERTRAGKRGEKIEDKKTNSILHMFGNDQKRTVAERECARTRLEPT